MISSRIASALACHHLGSSRRFSTHLGSSWQTAWLMLDEMEMQWVPLSYTWRLNERHYGALQAPRRDRAELRRCRPSRC